LKRREFIMLLGSAVVRPLAAQAQQPAMPVIGFLHTHWVPQAATLGYLWNQVLHLPLKFNCGKFKKLHALSADNTQSPREHRQRTRDRRELVTLLGGAASDD